MTRTLPLDNVLWCDFMRQPDGGQGCVALATLYRQTRSTWDPQIVGTKEERTDVLSCGKWWCAFYWISLTANLCACTDDCQHPEHVRVKKAGDQWVIVNGPDFSKLPLLAGDSVSDKLLHWVPAVHLETQHFHIDDNFPNPTYAEWVSRGYLKETRVFYISMGSIFVESVHVFACNDANVFLSKRCSTDNRLEIQLFEGKWYLSDPVLLLPSLYKKPSYPAAAHVRLHKTDVHIDTEKQYNLFHRTVSSQLQIFLPQGLLGIVFDYVRLFYLSNECLVVDLQHHVRCASFVILDRESDTSSRLVWNPLTASPKVQLKKSVILSPIAMTSRTKSMTKWREVEWEFAKEACKRKSSSLDT
jgi:hypothetical protein